MAATSKTEQIMAAIKTALEAAGVPAGVTVNRQRRAPANASEYPVYSLYCVHEDPAPAGDPRRPMLTTRHLQAEVVAAVLGTDTDADPHRIWIVAQVLKDPTLGGLAKATKEIGTDWDGAESAEGDATFVAIRFDIEYFTKVTDITQ